MTHILYIICYGTRHSELSGMHLNLPVNYTWSMYHCQCQSDDIISV